jgi:hypothetical protein
MAQYQQKYLLLLAEAAEAEERLAEAELVDFCTHLRIQFLLDHGL